MMLLRYNGRDWFLVVRRRETGQKWFSIGPYRTPREAVGAIERDEPRLQIAAMH